MGSLNLLEILAFGPVYLAIAFLFQIQSFKTRSSPCGFLKYCSFNELNSSLFRRSAAIVGQRSNVADCSDFNSGILNGTDCRLTSCPRSFHEYFNLTQSEFKRLRRTFLRSSLSSVGRVLF